MGERPAARYVGLLPAAGRGTRLAPVRYPKELLPIVYESGAGDTDGVRVRAVAEYALQSMRNAGVDDVLVVIAPWKLDILTYLGDGANVGLHLGYVMQDEARGLPHALDLGHPWTSGQHVVFAMPDTIIAPGDALRLLREHYEQRGSDLALAVFPTDEAQRMGPVVVEDGRVARVYDKPAHPPRDNTWGAAVWGPRFAQLLHTELATLPPGGREPVLGDYFQLAVERGLQVDAVEFPHGSYEDAGTRIGILRCLDGALGDPPSVGAAVGA